MFSEKLNVENDKNSVVLKNLALISNYTAKIHTINARYKSEAPSVIIFLTPEGCKFFPFFFKNDIRLIKIYKKITYKNI